MKKSPAKSEPRALPPVTDEMLDSGADMSAYLTNPRRVEPINLTPRKVNIDFPAWVIQALDRESNRIGVPRQSMVKMWIVERLEHIESTRPFQPVALDPQAHEARGRGRPKSAKPPKAKRVSEATSFGTGARS